MDDETTTCRICESACGLLARTTEDGQVELRPDPNHPISAGYACRKGTRFVQNVQNHPARIVNPWVDGQETTWPHALSVLRDRWNRSINEHGRRSAAIYSGNAMGHSLGGVLAVSSLQRALGTPHHYSCLTLDNSEMFVVAEEVFGECMTTFVADYAHSDLIVLIGTDPLSSQASQAQSHPTAGHQIRQKARAGQLIVVDPRRSTTARAASWHLQSKPGTDVFLLAWLVRTVLESGRSARPATEQSQLLDAVAAFDVDRVAEVTGLSAGELRDLARRWLDAERPLVWSGLGVLLSEHGTLGWWLTVVLQVLSAGLDEPGGWRWQPGPLALPRWISWLGPPGRDPTISSQSGRLGSPASGGPEHPAILGTIPAATLPDAILDGTVRSLVVFGGDPSNALPDSERARSALRDLDLLVSVDLFRRGTAALADIVLPAATWLERTELAVHTDHQRPRSHLRIDRPVLPRRGSVRTDWEIAVALGEQVGRGPFGIPVSGRPIYHRLTPTGLANAVCRLAGVSLVSHRPNLPSRKPRLPKAQLAVSAFCEALRGLEDPSRGLRLLTSVRPLGRMNHWLGEPLEPVGLVAPGVAPEGPARLLGPGGSLSLRLRHDPTLHPDVIVVPYGPGPGNPNVVVSRHHLEAFTGQPISNGTLVRLEPHTD